MIFRLSEDKEWLILEKASDIEIEQLNISLTKRIKNWKFHPLVQKKIWDGYFNFFKQDKFIRSGLWKEVYNISKEFNYEIELNGISKLFNQDIDQDEFNEWASDYFKDNPMQPRDYQLDTAFKILKYQKCVAELATSAGKTLILFIIFAYLKSHNKMNKMLLIVPNVSLVIQTTEDFDEYNFRNKLDYGVQQIYAGSKLKDNVDIVIGTYQSLVKKKKEYFDNFDAVMIDETHKVKAKSIKTILDKCTNAKYRFGLTGTVPKPGTLDRLSLMEYTGPLISEITANYLQQHNYISKCNVKILNLDYIPVKTKQAFRDLSNNENVDGKKIFKLEQDYIIESEVRKKFIVNLLDHLPKNTLVLFHRRNYGNDLFKDLQEESSKMVYHVDGHTDKNTREVYKKRMEENENVVLIASYGTFSTGISIKNIHYIVFVESFKSDIIIRQSIGRGLRKLEGKSILTLIDIVDDFRYDGFENYIYKHSNARKRIYKEQKFPYQIKSIKL